MGAALSARAAWRELADFSATFDDVVRTAALSSAKPLCVRSAIEDECAAGAITSTLLGRTLRPAEGYDLVLRLQQSCDFRTQRQ